MRKAVLTALFLSVLSGPGAAGAQENTIFLNAGSPKAPISLQWNFGCGYERALGNRISALVTCDVSSSRQDVEDAGYDEEKGTQADLLARLRWYPLNASHRGLFFDAGAGYTLLRLRTTETAVSHYFTLQAALGWKFVLKFLSLRPWAGYNISFGTLNAPPGYYTGNEELYKYGVVNFGFSAGFVF